MHVALPLGMLIAAQFHAEKTKNKENIAVRHTSRTVARTEPPQT